MNNNRGNNRRRGRGNNNRPQGGGQQLNRIDSRARGNAPQLLEKYRKLAQDAHLNGDRVQAEYYLQFADHYFRVISDTRLRQEEQRQRHAGGAPTGGFAGGVSGDRWQDQDGEDESSEFSMDGDFPAFDRPPYERTQPRREDREPRQDGNRPDSNRPDNNRSDNNRSDNNRSDNNRNDNRRNDGNREWRNDNRGEGRPSHQGDRNEQRGPRPEAAPSEPLPGEGVRAIEGEPLGDVSDNPFVRDNRPPRTGRNRTERRPRRQDGDEIAPMLDPSSLPPAIGVSTSELPLEAPAKRPALRSRAAAPAPAAKVAPAAIEPAAVASDTVDAPAPRKRGRPRKNPLPETLTSES